jgi:ABC-type bacteriocin/lantibiotic exporter with double-glycine peptidase domain
VLLQTAVDGFSAPDRASMQVLLLLALAAAAAVALHAAELKLFSDLAQRLSVKNTRALFDHVRALPMDFFSYREPEWIVGVLESNRHVAALICEAQGPAFTGIIGLPVLFLLMLHYDSLAAASILAGGVAVAAAERLQRERRSGLFRLARSARSQSDAYAELQLARIESLKIGGRAEETMGSLTGFQALAIEAEQGWNAMLARAKGLRTLVLSLSLSCLLALLAGKFGAGDLTAGGMAALWVLGTAFLQATAQWAGAGETAGALRDALVQQEDVASTTPETPARVSYANASTMIGAALLEARSLSFGYSRWRPPVIDGVSLTLMQGAETGILALPGSGASTLVRLLTGMQEPWTGEVLLQGTPVRALPGDVLAQALALVTRDGILFEGTVRDNVCLWDEQVSDATLAAALEDACIADVLARREGGHLHWVAPGGANFSGGERQRLLIARALVRAPRLLILDNATDLLDLSLEAQVRTRLRQRGCAALIVSQRLDTLQSCQQILMLKHGRLLRQA